jgi:RNA polymerase sigma-70 factor, ECF subfamily
VQAAAATRFVANPTVWTLPGGACPEGRPTPTPLRTSEIEACRAALMRYAMRAMRNVADAEDVVQDTLAAAMLSTAEFSGRSSPMTWLHGILKHKIIDAFRRKARETSLDEITEREGLDDCSTLFSAGGQWQTAPAQWGNPEGTLASRDFLEVLESCIACLPKNHARIFMMRELMDMEVGEICDTLGISPNNCAVMLHRARMKLRVLLEQRWFVPPRTAA